jgi:hypothetical protein
LQERCTVYAKSTIRTRWYSLVTRLRWKLDSVCLEIVLILTQDRCTVCTEHIIGLEIILDALGDVGHVESYFDQFGDSVSIGAR